MKINPNHAGWLLHSTMVNKDGSLISQVCYQHSSSLDMLALLKERKEWAKKECQFPMHFHLIQITTYAPSNGFVACTYPLETELEFYAKHEQELIDAHHPKNATA
jgi:hypothetical protein